MGHLSSCPDPFEIDCRLDLDVAPIKVYYGRVMCSWHAGVLRMRRLIGTIIKCVLHASEGMGKCLIVESRESKTNGYIVKPSCHLTDDIKRNSSLLPSPPVHDSLILHLGHY